MDQAMEDARSRALEAMGRANLSLAQYRAKQNPIFLWAALRELSSPALAGAPIGLPDDLRNYLHAAASGIVEAAISPLEEFQSSVMKALQLDTKGQGRNAPKEYAKLQSASAFLGIYLALSKRHKADGARKMMADTLGTTPSRIKDRVTEARNDLREMAIAHGEQVRPDDELGDLYMHELPDLFLLNSVLPGLPNHFWVLKKSRS
jgi:hypothetical protein